MANSFPGDRSAEPDLRILATSAWVEKWALAAVALVAGSVLLLWFLPPVAAMAPTGWSKMTANAAVGMLLAVASAALSASPKSHWAPRIGAIAGWLLLALGGLTLAQYAGPSLGLDHWLPENALAAHPGRMSPQTSFNLALIGLCLALTRQSGNWRARLADASAITLIGFELFLFGGHLFHAMNLIGVESSNLTSPQTLFCLVLLTLVIGARRAGGGGALSFWMDRGIGSRIARTVLPGVIALPFLMFGLIQFLDDAGLLPAAYTRAIATPFIAIAGLVVVHWMGERTNRLERELRQQSLTDQLTNVFNRRGFYVVADYAIRNAMRLKNGLVLFYFDLDGLKNVNDSLGHEAGSRLIQRFAAILAGSFRNNDVVGRIGGDEFVVLAANTFGTAEFMLARLARTMAKSNDSGAPSAGIAYSAGYADVPPLADVNIDDLIARADAMMYAQKVSKRTGAATPRPERLGAHPT